MIAGGGRGRGRERHNSRGQWYVAKDATGPSAPPAPHRPFLATEASAQHQVDYCYRYFVHPSVCL